MVWLNTEWFDVSFSPIKYIDVSIGIGTQYGVRIYPNVTDIEIYQQKVIRGIVTESSLGIINSRENKIKYAVSPHDRGTSRTRARSCIFTMCNGY